MERSFFLICPHCQKAHKKEGKMEAQMERLMGELKEVAIYLFLALVIIGGFCALIVFCAKKNSEKEIKDLKKEVKK
jgi:flagellar biosynthesis/type III secretory pathway M-ring protein FliF/YscJ